ncbi:MAG: Mu transposase C-terminal domain-containing protein [Arenimonas sp.]
MNALAKAFFKVEPGHFVAYQGEKYKVTHMLSVESVLATNVVTGNPERLRLESIVPWKEELSSDSNEAQEVETHFSEVSEDDWKVAQDRFQAIKPLLEDPIRTREAVEKIGTKVGVNATTLYKWMKDYQDSGSVSSLVPAKRGRRVGSKLISPEAEVVITSVINDLYLTNQKGGVRTTIIEVKTQCRTAKIKAPHSNTIRNRIKELHPKEVLTKRGGKDLARNRFAPIQGAFPGADTPLAVVQIDHTEADVILVDEKYRKPIARPWLTLAMDVYSRMVVGLYLSFEKPSATSVGMCLAQAICPKREYLARLGVGGDWPVWGSMGVVHADNAKEFRGKVLKRACDEYKIDLQWRPVQLPHFGGHIERMMRTMAIEIHKLPGTTFSNIKERKNYNSEKQSALTLREFERHIVDFIVNIYHERVHTTIQMPPKRKWAVGVLGTVDQPGIGSPAVPRDPRQVQLDFMPFYRRTVQQYGVQIDNINYYSPVLDQYINAMDPRNPKAKRKFTFRRDPKDISKIYFHDPADGRYVEVPYRNIGWPAISAWELNDAISKLKAEGRVDVDEDLIFGAITRLRRNVAESVAKTKAARKQETRIPKKSAPKKSKSASSSDDAAAPINDHTSHHEEHDEDPFLSEITPFADIR